jgi:hypothetical protein
MGLDTSHGCWHGPYSQFMRWRTWLAAQVGIPLRLMDSFYGWTWESGDLEFSRDYNRLTAQHDVPNRGQMWWDTLAGFESLGKGISWATIRDPLKLLLNHSDCDGRLKWFDCKPISLRLLAIIRAAEDDTKYPVYDDGPNKGKSIWSHWRDGRGCYDGMVPATKRFAVGCLRAFNAREDVKFR